MSDLKSLLKTTPRYINLLQKNGITSVKQLLQYFPRTYEDRSQIKTLKEISGGGVFFQDENGKNIFMTKGKIIEKKFYQRGKFKVFDFIFEDSEGSKGYINIFNSYFAAKKIEQGKRYIIIGKPKFEYGKIIFSHPEVIQTAEGVDTSGHNLGRLFPIYPELNGITSGRFAQKIWNLITMLDNHISEYLPEDFLKEFDLLDAKKTMKNIHYPENLNLQEKALQRIFFDRLLRIQLLSLIHKKEYQEKIASQSSQGQKIENAPERNIVKEWIGKLTFELTNAQKKVIKTMIENFHDIKPMIRLLQGDVGSGKTVVAMTGAYYTHKIFGGQSVFLAPLEVLAQQHYRNLSKLFLPLGIRTEIITGSTPKSQKEKIKSDLKSGKINVIIGTHAVIQEDVEFNNLKFAVIDEQHKFGVRQRGFLKKHGNPHVLQMSATPIPRSLALAFFGEFDVSVIDEMPVGRKPIQTKIISEKELIKIKPWIMTKIAEGQKIFVVTPLIEESEKLDEVKSATIEFEEMKILYPELKGKIGLLHGKLKPKEKQEIMEDFKNGKLNILVSTTVIEVGIDIPEATIMMIKNAERFGLSQLHQLRGRIGRSDLQSYCFLQTKSKGGDTYQRLKAMEETNDGFKLAQLDLQNRGAGEILGTRQSGETDIPYEILSDVQFIEKIQDSAKRLLEKYPDLNGLDTLKKYLEEKGENVIA